MTEDATSTAAELESSLMQLIDALIDEIDYADPDPALEELAEHTRDIGQVAAFGDSGILTTDRGFVVRMRSGAEFQITIVQSR